MRGILSLRGIMGKKSPEVNSDDIYVPLTAGHKQRIVGGMAHERSRC
jgi:hypothetical protein